MRALRYSLDEALGSLWRGRRSGLLATLTIALALFVLGVFLIVTLNLEGLADQWSRAAEISVYLTDEVTPAERSAIEQVLAQGRTVAAREYVSKTEALARFRRTFGELTGAIDGAGDNPLPASYEVRLNSAPEALVGIENLRATLRQTPGVADVRYDQQWLDRLLTAVGVVRGAGLLLAGVLTLVAALTVASVVRLALYARRDELDIMQLVGAPQAFVRGPFVAEGALQGGIGALVALVVLAGGFFLLRSTYFVPLASAINLSSARFLPLGLCTLLVLGGMAVGCLGGLLATRTDR